MTRYNPTKEILNAIAALDAENKKITAFFRDGRYGTYSDYMFDLLAADPAVIDIIDAETGEVIYTAA